MKNKIVYLIAFLFISINSFGQISHKVNFSLEHLTLQNYRGADEIDYTKVEYDDLQKIDETGYPELPVKFVRLLVPSNQNVKEVKVKLSSQNIINISSYVYPAQPDIPTSIDFEEVEFVQPDHQIYNSDEPFPDKIAKVTNSGYFDGNNHIVTLAIFPIQYLPNQNQLIFYSNIDIVLEMEATVAPDFTIRNRKPTHQLLYDNILESMVDNPEDIAAYQVKPITNSQNLKLESQFPTYEYVVITTNALKDNFKKFVEWKKRKGIDIGVVTVEDILVNYTQGDLISGINDEAGSIRQYLSYAYSEGTVWALLGGDYSVVPIRYGAGSNNCSWNAYNKYSEYRIPADIYFADFNGDWDVDGQDDDDVYRYGEPSHDNPDHYPEIFVGRLLTSSNEEVLNWIEKLIIYEQNPGKGDLNYLTHSFMHAADEMADQNKAEYVALGLPSSFTNTLWKELPSGNSPNPTFPNGAEVIEEMDSHYGYYNWFCHGSPTDITVKSPLNNQAPYTSVLTLMK